MYIHTTHGLLFWLQESLAVAEQSYFARFESPCCSCVYNSSKTQCKSECNSTFYQPLLNSSTESNISSVGDLNTQYSELFQRNVSFEESAVHVPGDIYYRGENIISTAVNYSMLLQL